MYLEVLVFPLLSAFGAGGLGSYIGYKGCQVFTCFMIFSTFIFSCIIFYEVGVCGRVTYIELCKWFETELFELTWGFQFDSLTSVMLIVVTSVSFLVHLYSTSYMFGDPHLPSFMSYLSLFTFFMLVLVTGDNFFQLFIGWEGVRLCSYLLINFWWTSIQANNAAIKAMVVNSVGDVGLGLGIFLVFYFFNSLEFSVVFSLVNFYDFLLGEDSYVFMFLIVCLFLIGAVGKSAQLGLHTWLPDAMEGPTPVSALIHAATMVTAGVFLLISCSSLIEYSSLGLWVITLVGALTAFFAATVGVVQNDLKSVIAYSTCSQLGYMVFACGLSGYSIGLFHLMNHAFFNALLFLSAGSVIHALSDEQDMSSMGGVLNLIPFTYSMVIIGSLSLMGFPFMTGFYSKDVILELSYAHFSLQGSFSHWLGTISAFFTAFYSFSLVFLTFVVNYNGEKKSFNGIHEGDWSLLIPLFVLSWGSIFVGFLFNDMIIGIGTPFWNNALYEDMNNLVLIEAEFLPVWINMLPVGLSVVRAFLSFVFYCFGFDLLVNLKLTSIGTMVYSFFNQNWFFDIIYNYFVVSLVLGFGHNISYNLIDSGVLEVMGPWGLASSLSEVSLTFSGLQSGNVYHYAFLVFLGSVLFLFVFEWSQFLDISLFVLFFMSFVV